MTLLVISATFSLVTFVYTIKPSHARSNATGWTWICKAKGQCERRFASENEERQSLATCNMICSNVSLIWPIPTRTVQMLNAIVPVDPKDFSLMIAESPSEQVRKHLNQAFELMKADLKMKSLPVYSFKERSHKVIVYVEVSGDPDPRLRLNTDESYELELKKNVRLVTVTVNIRANSFCGARHAFETLSQLVWFDPYLESYLMVQEAVIKDSPKFKYRGLLVDTARNYIPVADLIRTIDAMAASKLNTFHWHATDDQSFPLQLSSVPQLAHYGAYDSKSIYTRKDIKAVVKRARLRGIRVVIEIDTPAHVTASWAQASRENTSATGKMVFGCHDSYYQLNPLNDNVYYLLEKIYAEILKLTDVDDVFHLGGDEVDRDCWSSYIKNANAMRLWVDYTLQAYQALVRANGGEAPNMTLIWSSKMTVVENFDQLDRKRFTIQVWGVSTWKDQLDVIKHGFNTVLSHVDAWYLDSGLGIWYKKPDGSGKPYRSWQDIYNHQPWMSLYKPRELIVGGEACQWTELVGASALDYLLWPRSAALAERLWSDPEALASDQVAFRLDTHRNRLVDRGIGAAPIWPRWCSENPFQCLWH